MSPPSQPHRGSTVDPVERRVGPYRVLTRIGEGGMGVVHLAEAPDGRRVALKVLRPHVVGDDEGRERLAREVASLRKVRSRHVAEIIDADPRGELAYIVTRYVPGDSLTELVKREGPLRGADLDHLADHLLAAIRDVHASGVLHRDVKPTNVVMEGRSPVLIDFGLARLAEDPAMTATGILLGTPGYLAPELLLGDQPPAPSTSTAGPPPSCSPPRASRRTAGGTPWPSSTAPGAGSSPSPTCRPACGRCWPRRWRPTRSSGPPPTRSPPSSSGCAATTGRRQPCRSPRRRPGRRHEAPEVTAPWQSVSHDLPTVVTDGRGGAGSRSTASRRRGSATPRPPR